MTTPSAVTSPSEPGADLVARLADAATAAIYDQRQDLAYRPESLRGIVLEIKLDRQGQIVKRRCFVERVIRPRRVTPKPQRVN